MLKIEHLTKAFGNSGKGVFDIDLHIQPGEIYGFIGHNGAGKTTTIKAVTGLHTFDQGEVIINGKNLKTDPIGCKKDISYIPDNPDLYEFMTGLQYINFIADIFGVNEADRAARTKKYADAFSITDDLNSVISSYSHGMKQKTALIAALVHEPKLLIMDEPFVGLDPKAAFCLKGFMRELCDKGSAIFFSTHVLEVAEKLCDKVAIIKAGRIIADGTMEEVKGDESLEEAFLENA